MGMRFDANTAATPGRASTRRTTSSARWSRASVPSYAVPAIANRIVISRPVSKPRSKRLTFRKVLTKSMAPTSETSASDTWTTTSALRTRDRPLVAPRALSSRLPRRLPRDTCIAGNIPKTSAVVMATANEYRNVRQSTLNVM